MCDASWDSIHWLSRNCGNVENWVQQGPLRAERPAGIGRQSMLWWCSTRCMQYSVYAVLGVNSWSWHQEIDSDDLTSCSQVMVELKTRKREMRGDGANHHEELGLKRILCVCLFTLPDTAGTSPDLACNNTDTRSFQPNEAGCTPDFSYPLVSSTSFSSWSPISLFLIHNSSIIIEHKVMSSVSRTPCHDHELTPSTSIHRVQQTPSTAYTQQWVSSLRSHDYELTPEYTFSFRRASLHDRPPSACLPWELKVTLSYSHISELTDWWIESQHLARHLSTPSTYSSNHAQSQPPKCISKLARLRPPSLHNHGLQVHLQTRLIMASKCISQSARLWPPSASPNLHHYGLQVRAVMASKCISKLARLRPPGVSPNTLDYRSQVHL